MNKVILLGRIGQEPELIKTKNETVILNFSVATNRRVKDSSGDWKDETTWHNCIAFNKAATFISDNAGKGARISVEGHLQKRPYTDNDGVKKVNCEVIVEKAEVIDWKEKESAKKNYAERDDEPF